MRNTVRYKRLPVESLLVFGMPMICLRRSLFVLFAVGVPGLLGCSDFGVSNSSVSLNQNKQVPLTVNVAEAVFEEDVYEVRSYFGKVKPKNSSNLAFSRNGRVSEILVEVGGQVNKGDRIATLGQQQLEQEQEKLENEIALANQNLSTLQAKNFRSQQDQQQIRQYQQAIQTLSSRQKEIAVEQDLGALFAPFDGVVASHSVNVGDSVSVGRPVMKLLELGQPTVELNVPSQLAERIRTGQVAWVKKQDELVQVEVKTIAPELNRSSRSQVITLQFKNEEEISGWPFGETVEALFWIRSGQSGCWLPYSAMQREAGNLWAAYVLETEDENQIVSRRIVEVVLLEDSYALCTGALQAGDLFITEGLNRVVVGQQVVGNLVENEYRSAGPPEIGE